MPVFLSKKSLLADRDFLRAQLRNLTDDLWGTTRVMWESRLDEIDEQLRDLDGEAGSAASVALVFTGDPVLGQHDIRLDFTTQILDAYQKIVALTLADSITEELKKTGRVPNADISRLFVRDLVRGSMGFVLEELPSHQVALFDTPLKTAVESTTELVTSLISDEEEEFSGAIEKTQGRVLVAVQKFAKILNDANANAEILGDQKEVRLGRNEVDLLYGRLASVQVVEEVSSVVGVLLGILPESHQFEMQLVGTEDIMRGSISDSIALEYRTGDRISALILSAVRAHLRTVTTLRNANVVKRTVILEEVSRDDPNELLSHPE